jgi:hypothetical protein
LQSGVPLGSKEARKGQRERKKESEKAECGASSRGRLSVPRRDTGFAGVGTGGVWGGIKKKREKDFYGENGNGLAFPMAGVNEMSNDT